MSADKDTLKVYAAEADRYARIEASDVERQSLDTFLARLALGAHILDLGCGPGRHAAEMQARGFSVTAWDASPDFVAAARERGVDAHQRVFDDLAAQDAYDAVWASFSLVHAPRGDLPRHLAAIARALRPRGHLFLGMKLGEGEHRDALGRFYAYFTDQELRHHLAEAGFVVLDAVTDKGKGLAGTEDPFILMTARHG
jgi:SAM-dependent methyltransferase